MGVCRRLNRNVNSFRYALHVLLLDASMVGAEEPRLEIRKGEVDMGQNVHRPLFFSLDLRGCKVLRAVVRDSKFVARDPSPHSVGTLKFRSRRSLGPGQPTWSSPSSGSWLKLSRSPDLGCGVGRSPTGDGGDRPCPSHRRPQSSRSSRRSPRVTPLASAPPSTSCRTARTRSRPAAITRSARTNPTTVRAVNSAPPSRRGRRAMAERRAPRVGTNRRDGCCLRCGIHRQHLITGGAAPATGSTSGSNARSTARRGKP